MYIKAGAPLCSGILAYNGSEFVFYNNFYDLCAAKTEIVISALGNTGQKRRAACLACRQGHKPFASLHNLSACIPGKYGLSLSQLGYTCTFCALKKPRALSVMRLIMVVSLSQQSIILMRRVKDLVGTKGDVTSMYTPHESNMREKKKGIWARNIWCKRCAGRLSGNVLVCRWCQC